MGIDWFFRVMETHRSKDLVTIFYHNATGELQSH